MIPNLKTKLAMLEAAIGDKRKIIGSILMFVIGILSMCSGHESGPYIAGLIVLAVLS